MPHAETKDETLRDQSTPLRNFLTRYSDKATMYGFYLLIGLIVFVLASKAYKVYFLRDQTFNDRINVREITI